MLCGDTRDLTLHHVYHGKEYRRISDTHGFVVTLCQDCHSELHRNPGLDYGVQVRVQRNFEQRRPRAEFIALFGKSWITDEQDKLETVMSETLQEQQRQSLFTREQLDAIVSALSFDERDTWVKREEIDQALESQPVLQHKYSDIWARMSRYKVRAERQVKLVRARAELDYRNGTKPIPPALKQTDATIKALVEADPEVNEAELLLADVTYYANIASNYASAMNERLDIIRMFGYRESRENYLYK